MFARSLASKTYLSSQTLHLFPNTSLDQAYLEETQKVIDRYVIKKILMPRDNTYLRFHDGGTSTPYLYLLYLASKVAWITKLRRQYEKSKHSKIYKVPTWASIILKIFEVHKIGVRFINMIGQGDILYIASILQTY